MMHSRGIRKIYRNYADLLRFSTGVPRVVRSYPPGHHKLRIQVQFRLMLPPHRMDLRIMVRAVGL